MPFLLHQLATRAARTAPKKEAVRLADAAITYGELDASANALAHTIIKAGVRRGDRVGILLPKSLEAVVSVYGVMKAGAAYVPMDSRAPIERAATIANDCRISAIITTPRLATRLVPLLAHPPNLVVLVGDGAASLEEQAMTFGEAIDQSVDDPQIPAIDTDLAYILYTSGSTGIPKGVMLTHRSALTFVEWSAERIGIGSADRVSNHAPLHFDLSVFDLYLTAYGGSTVVLVPEDIAYFGRSLEEFIVNEAITIWYSVPSALKLLTKAVSEPGKLSTLHTVVFAGEVYATPQLRQLRRLVPEAKIWNLYGPTETNVCTYYRVDELPEDDHPIPIGRGCRNTDVFAINSEGSVAGVGEEGELLVRGATVMKGYWELAEKTAEVLVPSPLDEHLGDLVYRTGDIVSLRPDGNYEFLGRRDHQIKSRGFRIELGEIEAALAAHGSIEEAAVIGVPHAEWGTAVVAWVVTSPEADLTELAVKRHVASRLPRYMVPARVLTVAELPMTSTGKIDRPSLTEQSSRLLRA
jgi:amino acid adenylation domain-containing protein